MFARRSPAGGRARLGYRVGVFDRRQSGYAFLMSVEGGPGIRLYTIWKGMKRRCQSPAAHDFPQYGGKGVALCAEWQTFVGFLDWALLAGYGSGREIDRIDADGPYAPGNCRWTTPKVNTARTELDRSGAYLRELSGCLRDADIHNAEPSSRPRKLYDGSGLHLFISPLGCRSWRLKFRFAGKEKLLTLGRYPETTIQEARELAAVARQRIGRGIDPCAVKMETRARRKRRGKSRVKSG